MDPELVVRFKGDTKDFEEALDRVKKKLGGLNPEVNTVERSFASFAKGYLSVAAVIGAGKVFLDSTKAVQKYENQLKVASGTQESYAKNTAFLEGLAAKYNKNVIDLGSNFAQLTIATRGTNLEGAKTERLFAAVTATSAALQMSVDDTNGTFRAFIQMVSKGNVQAEELRGQLGERLYGAFNLAAKAMGKTTQELNKMLENGEVLASDLLPKLTLELENSFGDIAQENAHNLGSAIEYATGQVTLLIAELGKTSGATGHFTTLTDHAGEFLKTLREINKVEGFGFTVGAAIGGLLGDSGQMLGRRSMNNAKWRIENDKKINKGGNYIDSFPGAIGSGFGLPSSLSSGGIESAPNPAADEKARKAAERAAKKAAAEVNRWISDQIQQSKDRIAQGLADLEYNQTMAEVTWNGTLGPMQQAKSTGSSNLYDSKYEVSGTQLSTPIMGDGSMNYDHIIAGMTEAVDKAIEQQNRLKTATDDFGDQLNKSLQNSLGNAIVNTSEMVGGLAAGLVTGTATLADAGNAFLGIVAGLFQQIGEALSTYAATMIVADIAIGSMNPAGALIGAALAFGAAALARSQMQSSGEQAFAFGGIVQGRGGVDNVHTALTPGEMVLNGSQQNRLWGLVSGAHSGREFAGSTGGHGASEDVNVNVRGRFRGTDIHMSGEQGRKKNNYYN
ncbi:tape measure protein [Pedobacter sp.]|uniref:tape measure protein n=1 Tax=Pedobacter sp. TaxID=1411316 RepID=UPI003C314DC8